MHKAGKLGSIYVKMNETIERVLTMAKKNRSLNPALLIGLILLLATELTHRLWFELPDALRITTLVIAVALLIVGIVYDNLKFLGYRDEMRRGGKDYKSVSGASKKSEELEENEEANEIEDNK